MRLPDFYRDSEYTFVAEGVYDNDPNDPGGETIYGISRFYHPGLEIWRYIDALKSQSGVTSPSAFARIIKSERHVRNLALQFYRDVYWQPLRLDEVMDGAIAQELFEQSVNLGRQRAGEHLQAALNALNREQRLYANLVVDGNIGKNTLRALRKYLDVDGGRYGERDAVNLLCKILNVKQGAYYLERMDKSEFKEAYARGWFGRVEISHK
jgi:lysozyme family protein